MIVLLGVCACMIYADLYMMVVWQAGQALPVQMHVEEGLRHYAATTVVRRRFGAQPGAVNSDLVAIVGIAVGRLLKGSKWAAVGIPICGSRKTHAMAMA